jgi:16S rRNA processing protein RimM
VVKSSQPNAAQRAALHGDSASEEPPDCTRIATSEETSWVVLARLLRPQGRKGEILAELLTDFPERFEDHPGVFLAAAEFNGTTQEARPAEVASFWLPVGRNQGRIVLHFAGIGSIHEAVTLCGLDVVIPASERRELDDDASYVSDLIGCALFDRAGSGPAVEVGVVTDVQFATTPDGSRRLEEAAPLLAVETPEGDEVLIPFVKAFLVSMDTEGRRIEMSLPQGLVDVNRS